MGSACYYHPSAPAVGTCVRCGMPICASCRQPVGNRDACPQCAPILAASSQPGQPAVGAPPYPAPPNVQQPNKPAATNPEQRPQGLMRRPGDGDEPYRFVPDQGEKWRLLGGIGLSFLISTVLSIVVMEILLATGFGIGFLYIVIGYGTGFGLWKITGRGGTKMAAIAVTIMLAAMAIAHTVYATQLMNATDIQMGVFDVLTRTLSPMHWVLVAIGIGAAWRSIEPHEG